MSTHYKDDDHPDDSPTDELPVLSEMDVVEDFERTSVFVALEDTGRHATLRFRAPAEWDADDEDTAAQPRPTADTPSRNGGTAHDTDDAVNTASRFASLAGVDALEARVAELTARGSVSDAALADKDATIASLEERLEATRRAVVRRDETEQQLRSALAERELRIVQLEARAADVAARLAEQEVGLASREASLAERDSALTERDSALTERESALALRESELIERDGAVVLRASDLADRERRLAAREAELREREELSSRLAAELGERASTLTLRDAELTERQAELARSDAALRRQEAEWSRRSMLIEEREDRLVECETALEELEAELVAREQALLTRETIDTETETGTQGADIERAADGDGAGAPEAVAGLKSRIAELLEVNQALREQLDGLGAASATVDDAEAGGQAALAASSRQRLAASSPQGFAASSSEGVEPHEGRNLLGALRRSREEAAALADYIDGRRSHWSSMEATLAEQKVRIEELDRELEQRAARQQQAESVAAAETQRVADLKAEIVRLRFLAAEGGYPERNRNRAQPAATSGPAQESLPLPGEWASSLVAPLSTGLALSHPQPEMDAAPEMSTDVPATLTVPADVPASLTLPVEVLPSPPDVPAAADPAARILLDGDEDDGSADMERRLNESEAQLERTRAALRRLERILIERDRAMDIKNARIDALQAELQDKLVAAPHEDQTPRPKRVQQRGRAPTAEAASPTMLCLTGDAPSSYLLQKRVVTIGRSAECDIQVATHFVSREHARLSVSPEGVFIEDLGSKNGVFVNAVRVEREGLRHGDLVTVGETQFRFVTD